MTLDRSKPPNLGRIERARNQWILDLHQRRFPRETQRDQLVNPASVSTLPQAWCDTGTDTTLAAGDTLTVDVTISTSQTHVIAIATCNVLNTSAAGVVTFLGYFRSAGTALNTAAAMAERASWGSSEEHTYSAACLVESGSTVGFELQNDASTSREVSAEISVQVIEVSAQSGACCTAAA